MCDIFVNNIRATSVLLMRHSDAINDWMWSHRGCKLRLIYDDHDLDECFNAGIKSVVDFSKSPRPSHSGLSRGTVSESARTSFALAAPRFTGTSAAQQNTTRSNATSAVVSGKLPLVVRPYEKKETSP